jgi:hypothetical protein
MRPAHFLAGLPCFGLACSGLAFAAVLAFPAVARADVLELKDGRVVEGVVEKTGDAYTVRSRFGEATIAADQVKTWTKAKSVDAQWKERVASLAPDDAENRAVIAAWLKDLGRDEEATALAQVALGIDPENARAHAVLGHVRHDGVWKTPDQAKQDEGLEKHGDRWYTPEEWKNVGDEGKKAASAAEAKASAERVSAEVNEAVRLMMSPDPLVAGRGRARLESLAKETNSDALRALPQKVDDMLKARDALAAAESDPNMATVLGELRITYSKLKRPIQVFETSLASGPVGAAAPVRIQLPELEVIHVNTTVGIPAEVR